MVTHKLNCDQAVFWGGGGKGKKGMPDTFHSRVVCCPLIKAFVNIVFFCQILPAIQAVCNEGGFKIEMYLSTFQASGGC